MNFFSQSRDDQISVLLKNWVRDGWLRPLDFAFAQFLWHEEPDAPPLLILAAALTSYQLGRSHSCLDLTALMANPHFTLSLPYYNDRYQLEIFAQLTWEQWRSALNYSKLIGTGAGNTPLVLRNSCIYLRRYWSYEQEIRADLNYRVQKNIVLPIPETREILKRLFPASELHPNWQKIACALAATHGFSIITGGPGTGKTTTVISLLALLQELAINIQGRTLEIRLASPTGKAAARLNSVITEQMGEARFLTLPHRTLIPTQVTTLYRLLGIGAHSRNFTYCATNQLVIDVLIIDEASMIDLEMMAAVCSALPKNAQLILIGDKDQLAAVEAGAVFSELARRAVIGNYTPATAEWLREITDEKIDPELVNSTGLNSDQAVVMLRHSYRFSFGIGRFAQLVNAGNSNVIEIITRDNYPDLAILDITDSDAPEFNNLIIDGSASGNNPQYGYRHYLNIIAEKQPSKDADRTDFDQWARIVLNAYSKFQILCAIREGGWGVEGLNQKITELLLGQQLIEKNNDWYLGRPILVTKNDYDLELMNGDIGITLMLPDRNHKLASRVAFLNHRDQSIKWVLPSRLRAVETVFALTVHKAQGSEFDHVVLVLPNTLNPILTRELLYTGITRARRFLTVVNPGGKSFFAQIVQQQVLRASGLGGD